MDKIKAQANKLWQIISNPSTGQTYQQTLRLTWSILKETGQLLWLVVCLVLVLGDWFWSNSVQTGRNARAWVNDLQTKATSTETADTSSFLSETGKSLLAAGQSSVSLALNTARGQLGIEAPPESAPRAIAPSTTAVTANVAPETPVDPPISGLSENSGLLEESNISLAKPPEDDE